MYMELTDKWAVCLLVQKQGTQLRAQRSTEMLEAYAEHDAVAALYIVYRVGLRKDKEGNIKQKQTASSG